VDFVQSKMPTQKLSPAQLGQVAMFMLYSQEVNPSVKCLSCLLKERGALQLEYGFLDAPRKLNL